MQEINAAITKEEARDLMKKPENNQILVDMDIKVKMLLFEIKNRIMHFNEV